MLRDERCSERARSFFIQNKKDKEEDDVSIYDLFVRLHSQCTEDR
jgi:hypothetical protein